MKIKLLAILLLLFTITTFSQNYHTQYQFLKQDEGYLGGGFGVTWIDNKPFYTFRFFPELAFANFGVGLDLRLEFNADGELRTGSFNRFEDYLSIIRYVRYGYKKDPVYARVGALDYATLGHGSIMYLYNNSTSFDARKVGLAFDLDFSAFGFESVYSNFADAGVLGLRGYVRPLQFTELAPIPIIGKLEIGATVASDFNEKAGVINGTYNETEDKFTPTTDLGSTTIFGFDIGLPILRASVLNIDVYFDYAKIVDFGSGTALGTVLDFHGLGLVNLTAKLERRFNGENYLPSYFNALYEIERFNLDRSSGTVSSKIKSMTLGTNKSSNGWHGQLFVDVLGMFNILGSYQRLDELPNSGILHLATNILPEDAPYVARAGYDKRGIGNESAIFKLDSNSHLFAELGYKPIPFIIVSMVYHWTFAPIRDTDENIIDYETQKRIEPRISFYMPLQL
ncbi:MAG: hypothetical protein HND52_15920 [Ignavibacteriae bacterium]|nr:hypothetical protein [Ignavibacteriota bacterium]NOG99443.1 hypothetical protein [Ignavibacteriota bacterium]